MGKTMLQGGPARRPPFLGNLNRQALNLGQEAGPVTRSGGGLRGGIPRALGKGTRGGGGRTAEGDTSRGLTATAWRLPVPVPCSGRPSHSLASADFHIMSLPSLSPLFPTLFQPFSGFPGAPFSLLLLYPPGVCSFRFAHLAQWGPELWVLCPPPPRVTCHSQGVTHHDHISTSSNQFWGLPSAH